MIKLKKLTERRHLKNIQIKEEIQKNSKKLPMLTRYSVIAKKEKFMTNTARRESSKEVVECQDKIFSHRCSEEEVCQADNKVLKKGRVFNTPLRSLLKKYSKGKNLKLQSIEIEFALLAVEKEAKMELTQLAMGAKEEV